MIEPSDVIRRIEWYFEKQMADYLTQAQAATARPFNTLSQREMLFQTSWGGPVHSLQTALVNGSPGPAAAAGRSRNGTPLGNRPHRRPARQ